MADSLPRRAEVMPAAELVRFEEVAAAALGEQPELLVGVSAAAAAIGDPPRFALGEQTLRNVVSSLAGMCGQRDQAARHR